MNKTLIQMQNDGLTLQAVVLHWNIERGEIIVLF